MKDLPDSTQQTGVAAPPLRHVLIIGGGASGVLMAVHLLSQPGDAFHVTLVERRGLLGCGIAYSTRDPDHLLNTRVHNMSAFPDNPHHFHDWLAARPGGADVTGQCFVSRATYGAYLAELLAPWLTGDGARHLTCVQEECLSLTTGPRGIVAQFGDGSARIADLAVLATGYTLPETGAHTALADPWAAPARADPDGRVVIVGSGLTMVDQVLSLLNGGHRGEILALSRRGQLPRPHSATRPLKLSVADVPLGAPPSALLRWMRGLARRAEAEGGTWRDAVDGIRPYVRNLWRNLSTEDRARFLRHGATWWDVHRHRIPPASAARIAAAQASGQLQLQRAAFLGAERQADGRVALRFQPVGGEAQTLEAVAVLDCRGIRRDPEHHAGPVIASLLAQGLARVDPLRIGLEVSADCRLIRRDGRVAERVLAIGPVSRAAFWEITAIPDIREQTARLAKELATAQAVR